LIHSLPATINPPAEKTMRNLFLSQAFRSNQLLLNLCAEGLSQEQSLTVLEPASNCINWNLGHILGSRGKILGQLGSGLVLSDEGKALYGKGSAKMGPGSPALPLDHLLRALSDSAGKMCACLEGLKPEALDETIPRESFPFPVENPTLGMFLTLFLYHEGHHASQASLVRLLIDKAGRARP
jgi:hypothetical protein